MIHLGDITKINGAEIPPVDVITGGSPCQDLSIAGYREGLSGERSSLFMEQLRIIKEMRDADRKRGRTGVDVRPRYMVWENVPGAFSSNNGEDFRVVLEETARVADENAVIPGLEKNQKWTPSGVILADGFSIAWRVHDGQFWGRTIISDAGEIIKRGTPQRRRRISLVADFGGQTAPEILFERKSVSWDTSESEEARERPSPGTGESTGGSITFQERTVMSLKAFGQYQESDKSSALKQRDYKDATDLIVENEEQSVSKKDVVRRLTPLECERLQGFPDNWTLIGEPEEVEKKDYDISFDDEGNEIKEFAGTHTEIEYFYIDENGKKKKCSDSSRYKALGNSICLPFWEWMAKRICDQYDRPVTMGSLFDGIGGFPLAFHRAGAKPVWASEIEEFPIEVTKRRFGDE